MLLQNIVDDYLKKERNKPRDRSGLWNPSKLGWCYRRQYWHRVNEPESNPPDKRTFRVFAVGSMFHEFVQEAICKIEPSASSELQVRSAEALGYADMVMGNEVIEFKTQHSKAFWYMKKEGFDIVSDKYEHCLQGMFYCKYLNKPNLRLVYISKDDLCMEEFSIEYDTFWKMSIETELSKLNGFWDKEELPPAEPRCYKDKDGKSRECKYCGFAERCEQEEEVEVA